MATDIARHLALRHLVIDYTDLDPDASVIAAINENTFGFHQQKLACAYKRQFGNQQFLHVRTNLLELARANLYGYNNKRPGLTGGPATARQMARFYAFAGGLAFSEEQVAAFDEYVAMTEFACALKFASAWDLFFIEHRMGAWHSGVVAESDVAFDTVVAFNSRDMIKRILGIPEQTRTADNILRGRLADMLPEISGIPINPKNYPAINAKRR